jgi:hypothetical protein
MTGGIAGPIEFDWGGAAPPLGATEHERPDPN